MACTSRTVEEPCSHSTLRTSSSICPIPGGMAATAILLQDVVEGILLHPVGACQPEKSGHSFSRELLRAFMQRLQKLAAKRRGAVALAAPRAPSPRRRGRGHNRAN